MTTVIRNETLKLNEHMNGFISVFAVNGEAKGVTLKNLKYELDDVTLKPGYPVGVSNEFTGKCAEITVENGMLLVIINWGRS